MQGKPKQHIAVITFEWPCWTCPPYILVYWYLMGLHVKHVSVNTLLKTLLQMNKGGILTLSLFLSSSCPCFSSFCLDTTSPLALILFLLFQWGWLKCRNHQNSPRAAEPHSEPERLLHVQFDFFQDALFRHFSRLWFKATTPIMLLLLSAFLHLLPIVWFLMWVLSALKCGKPRLRLSSYLFLNAATKPIITNRKTANK